ncbi:MAG TPA: TonB-dependent receptor [Rhizomicrobium sp.]|nr:TonB-dependent receptor [Rhizomicrobium sp.]
MKHLNHLKSGAAALALLIAAPALAEDFNIPAGDLAGALDLYASRTGVQLIYADKAVRGIQTKGVHGELAPDAALTRLLSGTGFTPHRRPTGSIAIVEGQDSAIEQPMVLAQANSASSAPVVETVTVTSSKLGGGDVQTIPIAITELSQEQLAAQKIEGGPDLLRSVPNMTFTKTNFSSYNVQIRGIGTQAISASTDPGVAVSFNDMGLIHNRLFEQEFFDVQSVEVLRGPQGTLYGRNATGGVINVASAKPNFDRFEGMIKGEVGNYDSKRMVGMLNLPILDDMLAIRLAGSLTKRDGYDYNSVTNNRINGRDLWSLRGTLGFEPTPWLHGDVVWERFREEDNRSRTGKQLCHRDESPDTVGSTTVRKTTGVGFLDIMNEQRAALFSTGCKAGSLYNDDAFGTPNGLALAYVAGLNVAQAIYGYNSVPGGSPEDGYLLALVDPYGGMMQSRNLREVASFRDPRYRASSDIVELNFDVDLPQGLVLTSQSALTWDSVYSFQDFNRFNTVPIFNDTSKWIYYTGDPSPWRNMAPGGVFCDPQLGCSDRLGVFDVSSSNAKQVSQEVRLHSEFDGPFNFSAGANYLHFKTQDEYYVMSNLLTALAMMPPFNFTGNQTECNWDVFAGIFASGPNVPIKNSLCPYIDPNPVESIDGDGHNYFRSSNPYRLTSYAAFGEVYYNLRPDLKLTAGLRYTYDDKRVTLVPSQLLLAPTLTAGGLVGTGYPADRDVAVKGGEFTGRIGADWQPKLDFTDNSLVYGFYSRGYKAGGVNPPTPGFATIQQLVDGGLIDPASVDLYASIGWLPTLQLTAVNYGPTFKPEFVNAFEAGTKNTLLDGRLTLNASAFFYDYKDYQVSQIRDRTAVNENFDAKLWGTELSAEFEPINRLRFNANIGYLKTRIADGEKSIDPMNRNLGNPDYTVFKPWAQLPSNCVVPTHMAEAWLDRSGGVQYSWTVCGGLRGIVGGLFGTTPIDPATGQTYDPATYPELNGGAGLYTDVSGNELPNSPQWTLNVGAEYSIPFADEWAATVRTDMYWQAQSWWRVYNLDPFDRLEAWTSVNFTVRVDGPDGLSIEAYVKNAFDNTAITGAFLNSDDSGLTTNIFTTDPRLIGLSITKTF